MGKLEGKVALVTGSGRNIGRATVLKLADEGANVVVNARSNQVEADTVAAEARERGVKALSIIADVAKQDQVDAMVARALSEFDRIDILINNAAIRPHKPFTELTVQDWEYVRGVVLDGAMYFGAFDDPAHAPDCPSRSPHTRHPDTEHDDQESDSGSEADGDIQPAFHVRAPQRRPLSHRGGEGGRRFHQVSTADRSPRSAPPPGAAW